MEVINAGKVQIGSDEQKVGKMQIPIIKGQDGENGVNGNDGIDGISITKIEQIIESAISEGINQIKITLSDGTSSIFNIRNGSQGEPGKDGTDGKEYDDTELKNLIAEKLEESKQYTDTEIANFDFVKIVDTLPNPGLPNRVYFVPKAESETNNLFDEYAWINETWEYFGTKTVEIDLTDINSSISDLENNKADISFVQQMTGIPQDGIIQFDGDEIPEGYEEIQNPNLEVYSIEEVKTNKVWKDGEKEYPVYRKVIVGPVKSYNGTTAGTNFELADFPATNKIIENKAMFYNSAGQSFAFYNNSSGFAHMNGKAILVLYANWGEGHPEVTLEYIKTTD